MATSPNSYDYTPLLIKVFKTGGEELHQYLIDGCTLGSTIELAKEKQKVKNAAYFEVSCRKTHNLLCSSKYTINDNGEYMSWEEIYELQQLTDTITDDAKTMVQDYTDNPSTLKGQVDTTKNLVKGDGVVVHSDSPILNEDTDERKG